MSDSTPTTIELLAGRTGEGKAIVERLPVSIEPNDTCRLLRSPAFAAGAARDDVLTINRATGQYEVVSRAGNLAVRVYGPLARAKWVDALTAELEKLGGQLDEQSPRLRVYSIHVSCGFDAIEALMESHVTAPATWQYGNVYSLDDGVTPLNWWQSILTES